MTPVSRDALEVIYPHARASRIEVFTPWLNATMEEFEITTPERQAAFLAHVGVESGQLNYVRELYSGEAYDVGKKATALGNTPADDGDGEEHRGAGLIQITGTYNQNRCADHFGIPRGKIVEWLQTPEGAARSAGWFWESHGCNELADCGDFRALTKRINGGFNGYNNRLALFQIAQEVLL